MNQERFKQQLVRDREWLRSLYEADSVSKGNRFLTYSSDSQIDTLAKFFFFISNGEIKISKANFEKLTKRQLSLIRKTFEAKSALRRFLASDRQTKVSKLRKLLPVMPELLFTLFNL